MRIRLIFVALAAALLMALSASAASARNISISHPELWNAVWSQVRFQSGGATAAACSVTLEGSFHYRTFLKVREALIGYVTRAIMRNCTEGSATVLTTNLPWHIRYQSFEGTLPNILAIRVLLLLEELQIKERIFGTTCLKRTTNTEPDVLALRLTVGLERRLITGVTHDEGVTIRCGILNGSYSGTGTISELPGGNTNLLVRLI
jgi:hypothetical protein